MDRRTKFKQGLCNLYLPLYEALCEELPPEWQPYSGLRTFDEQTNLWNQGRSTHGSIVTNARAGESAHNWGCGSDWTIWNENNPIWMKKDDPKWDFFVTAVEKVGLRSGKEFGDVDHAELKITCSWPCILIAYYKNKNMTQAYQKIEESMECAIKPKQTV